MVRIARRLATVLPIALVAMFLQAPPATAATGTWAGFSYSSPPYYCTATFQLEDAEGNLSPVTMSACVIKNGIYYQGAGLFGNLAGPTLPVLALQSRYRAGSNEGQWTCIDRLLYVGQPRACFSATASGSTGQYVQGKSEILYKYQQSYIFLYPTSYSPSVALS